jgi:hypothetical protein
LEPTGCDTSHGSIAEYKGQWYMFYHNQALSGHGNLRTVCIDYLYFNEDGTIKTVKQNEGVKAVRPVSSLNPALKKYSVENCIVAGGANIGSKAAACNERIIKDLHIEGSFCEFQGIDSENGGRATIHIHYATSEKLAKLNLIVNDTDYTLINAPGTGGMDNFSGCTYITVKIEAGETNIVKLGGGNGRISIDYITVSPFKD